MLSNAHSASALKAEWEADPLDQHIVASVQMRLRNCRRWNPKKPKAVQVRAKSLGNMFGGARQSFREHLAEGRAAVASWQVDFEKQGQVNHVQLRLLGLVTRRVASDSLCRLMHRLDQPNVCDKFAAMLLK